MKVIAYTLAFNEERMIRFWLDHYSRFATKLVVYDNCSTDNTRKIVQGYPNTEVREYDTDNKVVDSVMLQIKNECYKEARGAADYVVVGDVDEHLHHEDMSAFLRRCLDDGVTLPRVEGYEMVGTGIPESGLLADAIRRGVPSEKETKQLIFSPLIDINFFIGAHHFYPRGPLKMSSDCAKLLHYKFVSLEYVVSNYSSLGARLSEENRAHGWGKRYLQSPKSTELEYIRLLQSSRMVVDEKP